MSIRAARDYKNADIAGVDGGWQPAGEMQQAQDTFDLYLGCGSGNALKHIATTDYSPVKTVTPTTASYTVKATDEVILANGTTNQDIVLPVTGIPVGKIYRVKQIFAAAAPINVQTSDGSTLIDGTAGQYQMYGGQYTSVSFLWDGTQYWSLD
jgi:hypothetical protein